MKEINFRIHLKSKVDGEVIFIYVDIYNQMNGLMNFPVELDKWEVLKIDEYTGKRDQNGNKAYYKDIIEYEGWKYVVEWDDVDTGYYLADYKYLNNPLSEEHRIGSCITEGEIIGNTYLNPELLQS